MLINYHLYIDDTHTHNTLVRGVYGLVTSDIENCRFLSY